MTFANHSAQAALLAYYKTRSWTIALICAFVGAIPDLSHLFDKKGEWSIYEKLHMNPGDERIKYSLIAAVYILMCIFLPVWTIALIAISYLLHITEDWWVHKPGGGWESYTIYVEISLWIAMITAFLLIIL